MKELLLTILFLASTSVLSFDVTEFEKGFNEGLKECPSHHAYSCYLEYDYVEAFSGEVKYRYASAVRVSRGAALSAVAKVCYNSDVAPRACLKAFRANKTVCTKM